MAERKAVNKYYPPDWDPSKGSLNRYHRSHPLRKRASKLKTEHSLIVRFEMPYNVWCLGCNNHIGKGKRYNATKKEVGAYFSSKIFEFRMRCHLCPNIMVMQNDPKNSDYAMISGIRQKIEDFDPESAGLINIDIDKTREKMDDNPFFKLEHNENDEAKGREASVVIADLLELGKKTTRDNYGQSKVLRKAFREQRKGRYKQLEKDAAANLPMALLPASAEDYAGAEELTRMARKKEADLEKKLKLAKSGPIFAAKKTKTALEVGRGVRVLFCRYCSFFPNPKRKSEIKS